MNRELIRYTLGIYQFIGLGCFIPIGRYFLNLIFREGDFTIKTFLLALVAMLFGIIFLAIGGKVNVRHIK